jgi:tRNA(Arg) A34 adenosine deaminase TadA
MQAALKEAVKAAKAGEIPVGCVIAAAEGNILARGHNMVEKRRNATLHAEMVAMARAMRKTGEKYLMGCSLYVTLEPCAMCAAAISHAKIKTLRFGAYDEKGGSVEHNSRIFATSKHMFKPEVAGGIMEEECGRLLSEFFRKIRGRK